MIPNLNQSNNSKLLKYTTVAFVGQCVMSTLVKTCLPLMKCSSLVAYDTHLSQSPQGKHPSSPLFSPVHTLQTLRLGPHHRFADHIPHWRRYWRPVFIKISSACLQYTTFYVLRKQLSIRQIYLSDTGILFSLLSYSYLSRQTELKDTFFIWQTLHGEGELHSYFGPLPGKLRRQCTAEADFNGSLRTA